MPLLAPAVLLCGCSWPAAGLFASAGPVAAAQRDHLLAIVGWMMIVILPVFVALPVILWRYRLARRHGRYAPDWRSSRLLEALIWGIPLAVVVVLGVQLWRSTHALDPYAALGRGVRPLEVQVICLDWKFLFIYPASGIASVNDLVIPVGRPVHFSLTSATVMQSFVIPRLGGQIYAMAGMTTELNLLADETGWFRGQNTQYNGAGFAQQKFQVRAVTPQAFAAWTTDIKDAGDRLDDLRYARLARPGLADAALSFGAVATGLFDRVLTRSVGAPVPR